MNEIYIKREDLSDKISSLYCDCADLISLENILLLFEEIIYERDNLLEKIEDMEKEIEDNYKRINIYDQLGISENDFH